MGGTLGALIDEKVSVYNCSSGSRVHVGSNGSRCCSDDEDEDDVLHPIVGMGSTAIVGFCCRGSGKWLGKETVFGFDGGVVCKSSTFGRNEEWEVSVSICLIMTSCAYFIVLVLMIIRDS